MHDLISCVLYLYCSSLISLFMIQNGQTCSICSFGSWMQWGGCSQSCGGGIRERQRVVCCSNTESYAHCIHTRCRIAHTDLWQSSTCNKYCYNGGIFDGSICKCSLGWKGDCCNAGNFFLLFFRYYNVYLYFTEFGKIILQFQKSY